MDLLRRFSSLTLLIFFILSACSTPTAITTETPSTVASEATTVPSSTVSPTPEPVSSLTICTVGMPDSLFLYAGQSSAARSAILAMLREDLLTEEAGLLSEFPSEANGGLRLEPIDVVGGQTVVDAYGELMVLKAGVTVRPSGCRDASCTIIWDGESDLQMDRMVMDFHLTEGLTWSDGVPVTAGDSVFSFQLASGQDAPGLKWAESRTTSYTATDDQTLTWIGKPGFTTADLESLFWTPLPAHNANGETNFSAINEMSEFSTLPLSYGPFSIVSSSEELVQLERNPYYYRVTEGLPYLDEITVRAIGNDRAAAIAALENGDCDVLDASFGLENEPQKVAALQSDDAYTVFTTPGSSWVQLVFGITPVSYDEYYNPLYGDRPDYFGDERVRQAVAMCLDRELLLSAGLSSVADLWFSFLPQSESQLPAATGLDYDLSMAISLLEAAGWRDHDLNPETPLQAWEVAGVPVGTDFSITLLTDTSTLHQNLAVIVQDALAACGIEVTLVSLPTAELYAPGPDGLVFGRQFDLTFISWQPMPDLDCGYYHSWQIPSEENQWIGTNIAGLNDGSYDQACSEASLSLPVEYADRLLTAEETFLETSASIPLLSISRVVVAASKSCQGESISTGDSFFDLLEYYSCP